MSIANWMKKAHEVSDDIWEVKAFNWIVLVFTILLLSLSIHRLWSVRDDLLVLFFSGYLIRMALKNLWRLYEIEEKGAEKDD